MGEAPTDNPADYLAFAATGIEICGMIVDAPTQTIWMTEHGPKAVTSSIKLQRAETMVGLRLPMVSITQAQYLAVHKAPSVEQPVTCV